MIFILEPSEPVKAAIGKYVTVFDYPDGRLSIRHDGVELAYRTFDKVRQVDQDAIADKQAAGGSFGNDSRQTVASRNRAAQRAAKA